MPKYSAVSRARRRQGRPRTTPQVTPLKRSVGFPSVAPFMALDSYAIQPKNAWLLIGGDDSYYSSRDLSEARKDAKVGDFGTWTAAKQTEPGDLLFWYFTAPRKEIHFVGRAVDHAYFEDIGETGAKWQGKQWWCHTTAPVAIEPITLADLKSILGNVVMLGKSGRYLHTEHANDLAARIRPRHARDRGELERVLRPVVGDPRLPDPALMDLDAWRGLAAGQLALENHVEQYLVKPLLRLALDSPPDDTTPRQYPVGHKLADYAVIQDNKPTCTIEVKLRVRKPPTREWAKCADFKQAVGYGTSLSCNAILMDAFEIHLIKPGADRPLRTLQRGQFTESDLADVRAHLLGLP